jgi:hypothetical protein
MNCLVVIVEHLRAVNVQTGWVGTANMHTPTGQQEFGMAMQKKGAVQ